MEQTAPSPFSEAIPLFQTVWDSTSLGWLKTCPRYYQYQMMEQWSPRSKGIHLMFGQLYASGVEHYARKRAEGASHEQATLAMVRFTLESAGERDEDGKWTPWNPPADHKDANIKNRYTLLRSLVWNVEDRLGSPYTTVILSNGKPAVELSFNFHAFNIEGENIFLSGHLDQLVEEQGTGRRFVLDDKTTKGALNAQYFQGYSPNNQMSLYTLAGKIILSAPVAGVLVRAAQIGVGFTRFATVPVPRSSGVLAEWLEDTKFWIAQAYRFAQAKYWPTNDTACNKFGGCPFVKVCSINPSHRQAWLEQDFIKHEWNPLQARGE